MLCGKIKTVLVIPIVTYIKIPKPGKKHYLSLAVSFYSLAV
jgi:hypothetical protein